MLAAIHRQQLIQLAKDSISYGLEQFKPIPVDLDLLPTELVNYQATFVTLELHEQLRGCIGVLEAYRSLAVDIAENSYAAAFADPRFQPVSHDEIEQLSIHISILSEPEPLPIHSESELITLLQTGVDGLILKDARHQATFLPSVWQSLTQPSEFVRQLKLKAGFPIDYWSDDIRAFRYDTESF